MTINVFQAVKYSIEIFSKHVHAHSCYVEMLFQSPLSLSSKLSGQKQKDFLKKIKITF